MLRSCPLKVPFLKCVISYPTTSSQRVDAWSPWIVLSKGERKIIPLLMEVFRGQTGARITWDAYHFWGSVQAPRSKREIKGTCGISEPRQPQLMVLLLFNPSIILEGQLRTTLIVSLVVKFRHHPEKEEPFGSFPGLYFPFYVSK